MQFIKIASNVCNTYTLITTSACMADSMILINLKTK